MYEIIKALCKNYVMLYGDILSEKKYLGDKKIKVCRFCNKKEPDVHFKQNTHALPEFIGNRHLFSYYECDECNQKFSILESNMSEYMKLHHTIAQVKGKKGIPSFKPNCQQKSIIDMRNDNVNIKIYEGDDLSLHIDESNKTISIIGTRTYIPLSVFKCLTKMALTVMPEEELINFTKTIELINGSKEISEKLPNVLFDIYDGERPFKLVTFALFKRKVECKEIPYMMFVLMYSNFIFQLPIISIGKMDTELEKIECIPIPITLEDKKCLNRQKLDLSSNQKIVKEPISVNIGYETLI